MGYKSFFYIPLKTNKSDIYYKFSNFKLLIMF